MRQNYHLFYFIGLSLFAASLPLSPFLLSVSQFILAGNWLMEGKFRKKLELFKERKGLWVFLLVFLLHAAGMIYTQDLQYGLHDLKIKLPLLILPVIIGTSRAISEKELNRLIIVFGVATFISTLICYYSFITSPIGDIKESSLFISHIRLSILLNLAIFGLGFLVVKYFSITHVIYKITGFVLICWMVFFLFLLQSITGIVLFLVLLILFNFHLPILNKSKLLLIPVLIISASVVLFFTANIVHSIHLFSAPESGVEEPDPYTQNGNPYSHFTENKEMEGGEYVWQYICESELEKEWNSISQLDYGGLDRKGQELKITLFRYMTSKGLRKDSVGFSNLTTKDIHLIESGIASSYYTRVFFPQPRIYQITWEIDRYFKGADPNGLSVAQRFEYWKTALKLIHENKFFGVGTGDVPSAFSIEYERTNSRLIEQYRLRTHNQFLTFAVALGIPIALIIVFAFIFPLVSEKKIRFFPAQFILIATLISMLNEDTLETQAGVSFVAFFYSLFIFGYELYNENSL